ncbi:MAG: polyphosphate kinase 1, partial [Chitinophagales bacterium]
MQTTENTTYINREISWLSFNERVLQEAADINVPLIDRIRFLGIFSNNLDEFFRVRVSSVRRMKGMGKKAKNQLQAKPKELLNQINTRVKELQEKFGEIYAEIRTALEDENIYIIDEKELNPTQAKEVVKYYKQNVRPQLTPIILDYIEKIPTLGESSIHLAIEMINHNDKLMRALVEIPDSINRFFVLPEEEGKNFIILLDDIIRYNLGDIFKNFDFKKANAYTIKVTLDAELDIDNDISKSLIEKISKSIESRKKGDPIRFIYDAKMNEDLLNYLLKKMDLTLNESNIGGARYHNFKDFMAFPTLNKKHLSYTPIKELKSMPFDNANSIFSALKKQDVLLHYPYHRFSYVTDFLREAAMSPHVTTIKMTLYRVANNSIVAKALINAAKNGKKVIAVVEVRA